MINRRLKKNLQILKIIFLLEGTVIDSYFSGYA